MVRRHHAGSGRMLARPVPDDWQDHHAGTVAASLDDRIRITAKDGEPWFNPETGVTEPGIRTVYDGAADVMPSADGRRVDAAGELVPVRDYDIRLPWNASADVAEGMTVTVDITRDPSLAERRLAVVDVERGTRRFSRMIRATL